nr:MAG TPA: Single strand binding protein [Caudoviricetes sp.]
MLNKAILNGRLTKAPELKQTNNGKSVCSFTIAVDRNRDREKTDFVPIVAWGKTAEFVNQWFGKGDLITIVGRIEVRNYEDKNGNKRTATEIIAEEVLFGGSKSTGKAEEKPAESEQGGFEEVEGDPNDLPFN